jgi:hypothetical protein
VKLFVKTYLIGGFLIAIMVGSLAYVALSQAADTVSEHGQDHHMSPAYHGFDYSLLRSVDGRRDNQLVAADREPDGNPVKAKGYGCGRYYSVRDRTGAFQGSSKKKVPCNLRSHWTIEVGKGNSPASKHD